MDGENLYEVLGLEPGASREQIERAYRFSMEMYAEDNLAVYSLLEPAELDGIRSRIREAHHTLSDTRRRKQYDEARGFEAPEASVVPFPTAEDSGEEPAELPEVLSGEDLKRIREARGVSLRQMANVTKIGKRFLEYIEEDRFGLLPAPVYLRGFLQEYARMIRLDPRGVADAYMKRVPIRT